MGLHLQKVLALLFVVLLLNGLQQANAQTDNNAILAGVDSVDARVALTWDKQIRNMNEETTRSRLQTIFELELRQRGIMVSTKALNFLSISLTLLDNDDGSVSFAYDLSLHEPGVPSRVIADALLKASRKDGRAAQWEEFLRRLAETMETSSGNETWVITWSGPTGVVTVGRNRLNEALERQTTELAQAFANAYLATHPKH